MKASPVSYFILGVELFHKKAFYIFSSSFTTYFGTAVMNDWKTIFDIAIVLKIFPSSVRFLIFHIFNTRWISIMDLKEFCFPLSIFFCKRSENLIFLTCRYLIYTTRTRLPLEPFLGLQYPQFQIFSNLVLIQKSTKKNQVSTICFIEIISFKKKIVSSA